MNFQIIRNYLFLSIITVCVCFSIPSLASQSPDIKRTDCLDDVKNQDIAYLIQ